MLAISHSNLETVMIFRACAPVIISILDYAFMGRAAPTARSSCSLILISAGVAGYVMLDRAFIVGGFDEYKWSAVYLGCIAIEVTYAKHILDSNLLKSKWGPTLYSNGLSIFPMALAGLATAEHAKMASVEWGSVYAIVGLSCALGVAMSYLAFRTTALLSATSASVFGVANKMLTIILNFFLLPNEHASLGGILSLVVCLIGASLYQPAPMRDDKDDTPASRSSSRMRAATPVAGVLAVLAVMASVTQGRNVRGADTSLALASSPQAVAASSPRVASANVPTKRTMKALDTDSGVQLDRRINTCLASTKRTVEQSPEELPLAPYVYGGRPQVNTRDGFGRLLYCEAQLPRLNHFLDLFLFSGSGSTFTISQGLQHKADKLAAARTAGAGANADGVSSLPAGANAGAPRVGSVSGYEGDIERWLLAQANLVPRFPAVTKNLRNVLTLARDEGTCNTSFACDIGHVQPLQGDLVDFCKQRRRAIDVSVHDGDVSHGIHDFDEWTIINNFCEPAVVNIFNSNIHPTHMKMVQQLDADPAWRRFAHGWVPFPNHFRYKNRTFHAYVHAQRYRRKTGGAGRRG